MIQARLFIKAVVVTACLLIPTVSISVYAGTQKTILMVRGANAAFQGMHDDITKDLKKYLIKDWVIEEKTPYETFFSKVKSENPDFLILMDNKSIDFGKRWNLESPKKIPGLGLMALNLIAGLKGDKNIAGITFESPAYTLITQFRYFVDFPIKTVLVFYRKSIFSESIETARQQLKQEKITLEAVDVEQNGKSKEDIEKFITTKVDSYISQPEKYSVLWLMLDSKLLSKELFSNYWLPAARKTRIPFLTGLEPLVSSKMNLAVFAVIPSMPDLAGQAVQIVQRILEENESVSSIGVEQLISVNKILNKKRSKELGLKLHEDRILDLKLEE
ncbi:MAG: hypothetical protein ABIQ95_14540 [Bdellovibrionia bacterium]